MALIDNLVSYYKLDESSGNLIDVHSTNDLTPTSLTYSATGKINTGISFNGSTSFANKTSNLGITDYPFSMSAWIKTTSSAASGGIAILSRSTSPDASNFGIEINLGKASLRARQFTSGSESLLLDSGVTINDDVYHHIVCVFTNSTNFKIYVDGVFEASSSTQVRYNVAGVNGFDLGRLGDVSPSSFYNGIMDEIPIFNIALTDGGVSLGQTAGGEVAELFNSGDGLAYPFSAATLRLIKIAGTFVEKPILTKVAGTFVDKPIKIKIGGTFQDA